MFKYLELKILVELYPGEVSMGQDANGDEVRKKVWIARSDMLKMTAHDETPEKAVDALSKALKEAVNNETKKGTGVVMSDVAIVTIDEQAMEASLKEPDEFYKDVEKQRKRGRPKKQKDSEASEENSAELDLDFD